MPSKSKKQEQLMQAVAHGWVPKGKKKPPVPVSVAKEFVRADQETGLIGQSHKRHKHG